MTSRGVLTVEPTGGLANRMRVVDSAVTLAEQLRVSLTVLWTRTSDLHARFGELFEALPGVRVVENSWTASRLGRLALRAVGYYRPYLDQAAVEARFAEGIGLGALGARRHPFIITCSRLVTTPNPLQRFTPVASLRREIVELTRDFDALTLGVHVRRGDLGFAQRSPTAEFVAWMAAELKANPGTRFFLATDSPEEEERLGRAFPGRITTRRKCYDRGRPEGVRDALVDLYGLAGTRRIAGSYASSFSEAASQIGAIELVVVGGLGLLGNGLRGSD